MHRPRRPARRTVLKAAACAALCAAAPASRPRPPNVLMLLSDDQQADTIHALGNDRISTPALDELVARGTTFTRAYIMGAMQGAVCVPSRSMLLTGRTLFRSPDQPPADIPLWPEVFRKAGYHAFVTGKWHNGPATLSRCFDSGASIFFGGMTNQSRIPIADFDPHGRYGPATRRVVERFSSELFADAAVEFLRGYRSDRPFFMWVAFTAPHDPRTPPGKYARMYDPASIPLPGNFMPRHPFDNGELNVRDEKLLPVPREPDAVRREIAAYYGMISHMDEHIGRILAALHDRPDADNTIIIFAGDNGLALGQHGLLGKQNLYEHSVRVPLVMSGPQLPAGRKVPGLCYLLDVFPTVCQLAGVPVPQGVEGRSLAPLAAGHQRDGRSSLLFAYRRIQRAISDGRWKLIRYFVGNTTTTQLFDLHNDPLEMKNLSADASCAAELARLSALLEKHRRDAADPLA